jgi:hypothetical protein
VASSNSSPVSPQPWLSAAEVASPDSFSAGLPQPTTRGDSNGDNQRLSGDPRDNSRMPPRPPNEYLNQPSQFIARKLENFYRQSGSSSEHSAAQAIQQATVRAQEVTENFGLSPEFTPRLAILGLYDFVIFCGRLQVLIQSLNIHTLHLWLTLR